MRPTYIEYIGRQTGNMVQNIRCDNDGEFKTTVKGIKMVLMIDSNLSKCLWGEAIHCAM